MSKKIKINYLDAFSGIGGFHQGLKEAGFDFGWTGFSEINPHAKTVYKKHFPTAKDLGDVRSIILTQTLPKRIDIFSFGFPCQDLSVAGYKRGLAGERSGLFYEALRIIHKVQPTVFIFENVKGLLHSNDWRDFTAVLRSIAHLGLYECEWQLLNSKWFLPQNRERVYFIGHLRDQSRPRVFPITGTEGRRRGDQLQNKPRSHCTPLFNLTMPDRTRRDRARGHEIRYLTPIEYERAQGFPDDWTKGISKAQRYKALGNTVSVPVVKEIGKKLIKGWGNGK